MQNFTTASLKGHRDIEEQILRLQNYINGSRYTVAITGAGISMAAGIMDFAHMNFPLVLQMSSSAVLKSAPNHYYNTASLILDDSLKDRSFRNCLAHYGLGQFLSESDLIACDPLKGLTNKAFNMDYFSAKEKLYSFLQELVDQIKSEILLPNS